MLSVTDSTGGGAGSGPSTHPRLTLSTLREIPAGNDVRDRKVQWTSLGT